MRNYTLQIVRDAGSPARRGGGDACNAPPALMVAPPPKTPSPLACPSGKKGRNETQAPKRKASGSRMQRPGPGTLNLYTGARGGTFAVPPTRTTPQEPPKRKASDISTMSSGSARRLRERLMRIPRSALEAPDRAPLEMTLTLPGQNWMAYVPQLEAARKAFLKRLARGWGDRWEMGKPASVWVVELQKRGAPHFHFLIVGMQLAQDEMSAFREWVSRAWWEVVASGQESHLKAGTEVDWVKSHDGYLGYMTKYLTKGAECECGELIRGWRRWAVVGPLPQVEPEKYPIPASKVPLVMRVLRKFVTARREMSAWDKAAKKMRDTYSCFRDFSGSGIALKESLSRAQNCVKSRRKQRFFPPSNVAAEYISGTETCTGTISAGPRGFLETWDILPKYRKPTKWRKRGLRGIAFGGSPERIREVILQIIGANP